ncbi:class I SAM-dependent methyltransferase [Phormidesmis priestleyi]|uniref:class I SAM-dependent methyltransferase n=1 Tax=Phormidesmis priestleyi TaxID=268141 RepID=UPI000AD2EFF7|nr:class I SAM-dependent methyltransferase [Phormidesmis priestleyi]
MVRKIFLQVMTVIVLGLSGLGLSPIALADSSNYEVRSHHNPDGIGKVYLGREIAHVMGYEGANWLERYRRDGEEQPQKVINDLNLKSTDVVADIGAGTGYFSFRIAPRVPKGKVLAVDVQPEMIEILTTLKAKNHLSNVEPILSSTMDVNLPAESVDVALMVDAYHEFEYPQEVMTSIVKALKPKGRAVLVEYRAENPLILIKGLHKMTQTQVQKEMEAVGLTYLETKNDLPQQHLMIFEKQN